MTVPLLPLLQLLVAQQCRRWRKGMLEGMQNHQQEERRSTPTSTEEQEEDESCHFELRL